MEKPVKRIWVRRAPKHKEAVVAGLSFSSPGECVETTDSNQDVQHALLKGHLQFVMSRPIKAGDAVSPQ